MKIVAIFISAVSLILFTGHIYSEEGHYARNKSVPTSYAEEDNVNVVFYNYTSLYRITATIPKYYLLQHRQADVCRPDFEGFVHRPAPYIAYYDAVNGDLKYAYRGLGTTGNWWRKPSLTFDSSGDVGRYVSTGEIAASSGKSYIVYYDSTNRDLKCVFKPIKTTNNGYRWNIPIILDSAADVGRYTSMVLDSLQHPHVAYYDATNGDLKYIEKVSAIWTAPLTIDSSGDVGQYTSISVDSKKYSHIAYYDATKGDLKYICWTDKGWSTPVVIDSAGDVGQYASLKVDSADGIHIAYYDAANGNLKYLYKSAAGNWSTSLVIDSAGDVGQYASLDTDSLNYPHIAYYDTVNGDLKYVHKTDAGWSIPVIIDSSDDVGQYASLKMYTQPNDARYDYFDAVFIAYYDAANGDAKFIHKKVGSDWSAPEIAASEGDAGRYLSLNFGEYFEPLIPDYNGPRIEIVPEGTAQQNFYDDGDTIVEAFRVHGWWRERNMAIEVVGGSSAPNVDVITISKRMADTEDWPQIIALYSSGHLRTIPHPIEGMESVCFGSSVLIGAAGEAEWPAADIKKVSIVPVKQYMDIFHRDGGSARVYWHVERGKIVLDVADIAFNTIDLPFATLRSMWMTDEKSVLAKVITSSEGPYNVLKPWTLPGDWWQFYRDTYPTYNTSSPDVKIEVLGPTGYFITRQAENCDFLNGAFSKAARAYASGGLTLRGTGEATYNFNLSAEIENAVIGLRYSDDTGNGQVEVFLDGVFKGALYLSSTGEPDTYKVHTSQFKLTDLLTTGTHSLNLRLTSNTSNLELDYFAIHSLADMQPLSADFSYRYSFGVWWILAITAAIVFALVIDIISGRSSSPSGRNDRVIATSFSLILTLCYSFALDRHNSNTLIAVFFILGFYYLTHHTFTIAARYLSAALSRPHIIPSLDFSSGIPITQKTAIVYLVKASCLEEAEAAFFNMEKSFKNNITTIGGIPDPKDDLVAIYLSGAEDKDISKREIELIRIMQSKYGKDRIFLFHRNPFMNNWSNKWGAYQDLFCYLYDNWKSPAYYTEPITVGGKDSARKKDLPFFIFNREFAKEGIITESEALNGIIGDGDALSAGLKGRRVENALVCDSDNEWPANSIKDTVGKMAHPSNWKYGIFQPLIEIDNGRESLYAAIKKRDQIITRHEILFIWQHYGQTTFYGKGAINIGRYISAIIKPEILLPDTKSHDFQEALYLPCALMPDVSVLERTANSYLSDLKKHLRWRTGDFQGLIQRVKAWKLLDALLRLDLKTFRRVLKEKDELKDMKFLLEHIERAVITSVIFAEWVLLAAISSLHPSNFLRTSGVKEPILNFILITAIFTVIVIPKIVLPIIISVRRG